MRGEFVDQAGKRRPSVIQRKFFQDRPLLFVKTDSSMPNLGLEAARVGRREQLEDRLPSPKMGRECARQSGVFGRQMIPECAVKIPIAEKRLDALRQRAGRRVEVLPEGTERSVVISVARRRARRPARLERSVCPASRIAVASSSPAA